MSKTVAEMLREMKRAGFWCAPEVGEAIATVIERAEALAGPHITVSENELGEEFMRCDECDGTDWGGDPDMFDPDKHNSDCKYHPDRLRESFDAALIALRFELQCERKP